MFSGLDFAIYRNGYIYHTKYDRDNIIPMSTFQNSGDNILNLIRAVADSPELSAPTVSVYNNVNNVAENWIFLV